MSERNVKEKQLMEAMKSDNRRESSDAFIEIYNAYKNKLFDHVSIKYFILKDDAEDIVQTVFEKLWESRKKYDPKLSAPVTWIFTIENNECLDRIKGKDPALFKRLEYEDMPIEHNFEISEPMCYMALYNCIQELYESYSDVIIFRYFFEYKFERIKLILGKNVNTLQTHAKRALILLKTCIEEKGYHADDFIGKR